ncbi:MAG: hypothetical protein HPY45_14795 [Anaerolineae bacterium]|nr:hypothetical protein [Anaerolineae bacterium]
MPDTFSHCLKRLLRRIELFCRHASGLTLRSYQLPVAQTVIRSCLRSMGLSLVVLFPRQSGKNELQAQIFAYLLTLFSQTQSEMISISPTFKPQTLNAMRRLQRVLETNLITRTLWRKESGYIYRIGSARIFFFSGAPESNIVGATASTLLSIDEAQDIQIDKYDKDIAPMAASTNATRVFWGTAWTNNTLLAREMRSALEAQEKDGIQRVFRITADDVAKEVPAYGAFVQEQIRRLGRQNPMVKSQFFCEEIDAQGGMFPPQRLALMQGAHPPQFAPIPNHTYAFLLDVGGEISPSPSGRGQGEGTPSGRGKGEGREHDSTALTIVEIDRSTLDDPLIKAPSYRIVRRQLWTGTSQTALYALIKALADTWQPYQIVIDATGIGAGIASFLAKAYPNQVTQFTFNAATKSTLGWRFLSIIDTGRLKDYSPPDDLQKLFTTQCTFTSYDIATGPDKRIKWSVPEGTRNPADGSLVHDDLVLSAALVAVLDDLILPLTGEPLIIPASDPLEDLSHGF